MLPKKHSENLQHEQSMFFRAESCLKLPCLGGIVMCIGSVCRVFV